jgi:hypothetical protein
VLHVWAVAGLKTTASSDKEFQLSVSRFYNFRLEALVISAVEFTKF